LSLFCLFPPSRGIPHKTKQRRQNSPALSQLPTLSLSLSSFAHLRGKENGFKKRETRREHAPPLNNISVPVVHHTSK